VEKRCSGKTRTADVAAETNPMAEVGQLSSRLALTVTALAEDSGIAESSTDY
jgi:hypothetical protein